MDKLFLHIGAPKTGTSALQVFFARNRRALLELGIDYLFLGDIASAAEGQITSGNGGHVSRIFFPAEHGAHAPDPEGAILNQFLKALRESPCQNGLLSSELISGLPDQGLHRLNDKIRAEGIQPVIIVYLRRQDRRMAANYAQEVKRHGCTLYPDEFIRENLPKSGGLDYEVFVRRLDDVFGAENIRLRIYEEAVRWPGRIIEDFMRAMTDDFNPLALDLKIPVVNPTPSVKELIYMLHVNRFAPHMCYSDDVLQYGDILGRTDIMAIKSFISPKMRQRIINRFADSNWALARARFDRDQLFDDNVETEFLDPREVSLKTEDWIDILAHLSVVNQRRSYKQERELVHLRNQLSRLAKYVYEGGK